MTRCTRFAHFLMLSVALGCSSVPRPFTEAQSTAVGDSVLVFLETFKRFSAETKWDSLVALYSGSQSFRFMENGQVRYPSAQAIREALAAVPPGMRIETTYGDVKVDAVAPGVATVSTLFETAIVDSAGGRFQVGGAITLVLRRETSGWRVITGHSSSLTPRAPAQPPPDWASLSRYRAANDSVAPPKPGENRVAYIGDSITESWAGYFPALFPGKPYIGRGISGQTTPQILVRFRQDVVALQPKVVVILAGTNDIAGNTGPSTLAMIQDNLASMAEIARANGIRVVLSSVLPVYDYPWKRGLDPAPKIAALNSWIRRYSEETGATYLDYHSAMVDSRGGLRAELTEDGVHPNAAGYAVMAPLAEAAIAKALRPPANREPATALRLHPATRREGVLQDFTRSPSLVRKNDHDFVEPQPRLHQPKAIP